MNQPMIGERRGRAKEDENKKGSVEMTTWEPGDQKDSSQKMAELHKDQRWGREAQPLCVRGR